MKAQCIDEVQKAIGRSLNQAERTGIEDRISGHMRRNAYKNRQQWQQMSRDQRLHQAASDAAAEIEAEAAKKKQRIALQIVATGRIVTGLQTAKATGKRQALELFEHVERIDLDRKGIAHQYFGDLIEAMEAINSRLLGLIEDPRTARAVIQEIFGVDSGSSIAKQAAKSWLDTVEAMRQRFNQAGGEIGKLGYGYIPQPHNAVTIMKAGKQQWSDETLPLLNRNRYVHANGKKLNDDEIKEFLGAAWETLATDGANQIQPGQIGRSMLAKADSEHREIHFNGPDEYLAYMRAYGRSGVLGTMQAHVGGLAKNISAVENFGPNPEAAFRVAYDTIRKQALSTRVGLNAVDVKSSFNTVMSAYDHPANATIANAVQGARNLQVASKLGAAVLSSVTDIGTIAVTARFHKLPTLQLVSNTIRAFGKGDAEFANRAGLIADSLISDMNRWAEGNIGPGWTSKAAQATMRLSLMNAWTDSLRRGFGMTMMGAMGKITREGWDTLDAQTLKRMKRAGINEDTWQIFQQATPEQHNGSQMLTKQSIEALDIDDRAKNQAITRLLAFITDESEYAVVNPDLMTRTIQQGGTQKGTAAGEIWRSAMLFKSFPIAMMSRHWNRMLNDETLARGGRMEYGAMMLTSLMVLGYVAMSAKDISKGKDPKDTSDPATWGAAFMQGGGLGILGDFFLTDTTRYGNSMLATLAGPLASTAEDAFQLTIGNAHQVARGNDPKAGAEAIRFLKSNTPLANLWYSRAAMDRLMLHNLQEMASPGYLRRMERRAKKDGQDYWWRPGESSPARAPDFAGVVGQ